MGWELDGTWLAFGVCSLLPEGEGSLFTEGRFSLLLEVTVPTDLLKAR